MSYQRREGFYDDNNKWIPGFNDAGMMKLLPNHCAFIRMFESIGTAIEPNAAWTNGYGHMVHAVNPEKRPVNIRLRLGEKCKSTLTDRRRVIFIGTDLGTLAIYEMRPAGSTVNRILYSAAPDLMDANLIRMTDLDNVKRLTEYLLGSTSDRPTLFRAVELYIKSNKKVA